jgi:hypothetical protein
MPQRANDDRLKQLFPNEEPGPPTGTFELGLVLGGTVSAGAYTAGALDYLLEALEAWHASDPPHRVTIKTAAGTSGGAVCTALLGLLSNHKVAHISGETEPGGRTRLDALVADTRTTGNPLWDLWVNEFRIERLLALDDITPPRDVEQGTGWSNGKVQHVASLLNVNMIDQYVPTLIALGQSPGTALPWFPTPFRAAVTVANMRGIPYSVRGIPTLLNFSGATFVQHDDHAWFAFAHDADPAAALPDGKREDEFWLQTNPGAPGSGIVGYDTLGAYATASGAMPLGLAARALSRPPEHYLYRPHVRPMMDAPGWKVDWPDPDWNALPDTASGDYRFTAVDGGTFNNDPVTLAHRALAGIVGRNPRNRTEANRAIFMIDPLADAAKPMAATGRSFLAVVSQIIGTAVGGARYLTADMELFADENVFSRFQLVPFRRSSGKVGEDALAGSSLFAAAGWCARAFRVHDFLLGRANMRSYLAQELLLSGDNPLFDRWSIDRRRDYATDENGERLAEDAVSETNGASYYLPVLPDVTGNRDVEPFWPKNATDPATLSAPLKARLNAVFKTLVNDNGQGVLPWVVGIFAVPQVVDFVAGKVVDDWRAELVRNGLLDG